MCSSRREQNLHW